MNGQLFNIQMYCTNDGPGIRTTVFFKGCPLSCIWCHNPESQRLQSELMYRKEKCVNCLRCIPLCPNDCHMIIDGKHHLNRTSCTACGQCTKTVCSALELMGYTISSEDVIKKVMQDKPFYDASGGGITLSGGEPLMQYQFCLDILRKAKEHGLHVCMETCGFCEESKILEAAQYVDLFLYDVKETDSEKHRMFTGVGNERILKNLRLLDSIGKETILRCPIVPGCNDNERHLLGIASIANNLSHVQRIELEPYHAIGEDKYVCLDRAYTLTGIVSPGKEMMENYVNFLQHHTRIPVLSH